MHQTMKREHPALGVAGRSANQPTRKEHATSIPHSRRVDHRIDWGEGAACMLLFCSPLLLAVIA